MPSSLTQSIEPPIDSIITFVVESPSPNPPSEYLLFVVKNGSNIFCLTSSDIPSPKSETITLNLSLFIFALISILLFSGDASMPFLIMLYKTCLKWSSDIVTFAISLSIFIVSKTHCSLAIMVITSRMTEIALKSQILPWYGLLRLNICLTIRAIRSTSLSIMPK